MFRHGTNEAFAALMAWPVERLFYLEEVRQTVLGNKEVIHGSEEEPDN
jgi:hypothetical protein